MVELSKEGFTMKRSMKLIIVTAIVLALLLSACTGNNESESSPTPGQQTAPATQTQEPASATSEPTATPEATPSSEPTTEPDPTEEPASGPERVDLTNGSDSTGNSQYQASHYGLHVTYDGNYVNIMNYTELLQHGADITAEPVTFEGFEYQAEDLQFHNGLLYFLVYDFDLGAYNLYAYDYENEPVKVTESTVYHYEFINGKIYYTKEFYQGPIYSMNPDGSGETELTQMRSHGFTTDGNIIYFYSTDAGTAPGIVAYNPSTQEETTVVFPFYSHNFIVYNGYIYYVYEGTYRSIHRISLSDQSIEDLWLEMTDFTISMNISDGMLYILSGNSIYKCNPDGSNREKLFENEEPFKTGLYIFGDRMYTTDGYDIWVIDRNDGSGYSFSIE